MDVLVEQPRAVRAVWIVTTGAESLADRIIHVLFHEQRFVALVAAQTENIGFAFEKRWPLVR